MSCIFHGTYQGRPTHLGQSDHATYWDTEVFNQYLQSVVFLVYCTSRPLAAGFPPTSPLGNLAGLGFLHPYHLVAVEQAQRIESLLHLYESIRQSMYLSFGAKIFVLTFLMASTVLAPSSCGR